MPDDHVATGNVDFVFKRQGDSLPGRSHRQFPVSRHDGPDPALPAGGQYGDLIAWADDSGGDGAAKSAKIQIGAVDVLHRQAECLQGLIRIKTDAVQQLHQ